jgi:hypothetical protein
MRAKYESDDILPFHTQYHLDLKIRTYYPSSQKMLTQIKCVMINYDNKNLDYGAWIYYN